jgi:hypothetical protein
MVVGSVFICASIYPQADLFGSLVGSLCDLVLVAKLPETDDNPVLQLRRRVRLQSLDQAISYEGD